ncbi:glucan endo-1,3-beta-glucosidase 9 [Phragmites australis]|uniref:glucan endo-1,3-beta-glucosidase 9 n=1 Tax=Phragmites australis TaxID=29695 RepID=UPI002D78143D|nr:glucan endo-1,3-beta-glucosidase 9 [Phragmites australis]
MLHSRHHQPPPPPFVPGLLLLLLLAVAPRPPPAAAVGVTWGFASSHPLPAAQVVRGLLLPNSVPRVRLAAASSDALSALAGTGVAVTVGVPDALLRPLAASTKAAAAWVHDNVTRYASGVRFEYIVVGDEPFLLSHGQPFQPFVVHAAENIQRALVGAKLSSKVKVVVPCSADTYQNASTLPSKSSFRPDVNKTMAELLSFLANNSSPFMVELNPFLSFQQNKNLSLDYYLFQLMSHPIKDGQNKYDNYFDASIDALVTALTKAGFGDMDIIVGRAGWPTDGAVNATSAIAQSFMTGLVNHLAKKSGTPLRPKVPPIETYLFSLLDEDQRNTQSGGYERHYGIFTFDGQAKYYANIGQGSKALKNAPDVDYLPSKWCVVDNNKDLSNVSSSFSAACSNGDCTALSPGGSCSALGWPGNVSYAFNNYYQQHDQSEESCNFSGLGLITTVDPSVDNCLFPLAIRTCAASSFHPTLVMAMLRLLIVWFCICS